MKRQQLTPAPPSRFADALGFGLKLVQAAAIAAAVALFTHRAPAQTIAHVDQTMANPIYVNVYWDVNWNLDHANMPKETIDAVTQAVIGSNYMAGLAEYGFKSASFGGGFLPDKACLAAPRAPDTVGFYVPGAGDSIAAFIDCERTKGPALFRQPNVVLNVILPKNSLESDFFSQNFCNGDGTAAGWHYHGTQSNLFTDSAPFTIVLANPKCIGSGGVAGLMEILTHEMVEAATDPSPFDVSIIPPHIGVSLGDEVGDLCEKHPSDFPLGTGFVMVSSYWSNAFQRCLIGPAAPGRRVPTVPSNWEELGFQSGDITSLASNSGRLDLFVMTESAGCLPLKVGISSAVRLPEKLPPCPGAMDASTCSFAALTTSSTITPKTPRPCGMAGNRSAAQHTATSRR